MKYDFSDIKEQAKAIEYINKLIQKEAKLEIKEFKPPKSNRQNRYLYACFKILSDYLGYTVEEIKQILKTQLDIMKVEKGKHTFYRSIAELDIGEMTIFIDFVRAFGLEHGQYIMSPDEFYSDQFKIEKSLNI